MPNVSPTLHLLTKMSGENQSCKGQKWPGLGQGAQRSCVCIHSRYTRRLHQGLSLELISMLVPLFTRGMHEASDCSEGSVKGGGEKWQLTQAW